MSGAAPPPWTAPEEVVRDAVSPVQARLAAATLDLDPDAFSAGSPLPPLWHWFGFHHPVPRSRLGPDGHPRRGGFLPPVPLPRRMWAGGRLRFPGPLRVGEEAERRSRVASVEEKAGRSGPLVLVTVRHAIVRGGETLVEEEQDLVYREAPRPGDRPPAPSDPLPPAAWEEPFATDPVLLFRFSALTANGHRIHYDHPYATGVEGYPGVVVHGPLLALLLLGAGARRGGLSPAAFRYRALAPLFCGEPLTLAGSGAEVWALGPGGRVVMRGSIG